MDFHIFSAAIDVNFMKYSLYSPKPILFRGENHIFSSTISVFFSIIPQKEEIAKEFELPERKSKIATIMKHDEEAYCICRSSDCSRFMM